MLIFGLAVEPNIGVNSLLTNLAADFSDIISLALSKPPLATNKPWIFANLKPKIPNNPLPTCWIILDNAEAVLEALTKPLGKVL